MSFPDQQMHLLRSLAVVFVRCRTISFPVGVVNFAKPHKKISSGILFRNWQNKMKTTLKSQELEFYWFSDTDTDIWCVQKPIYCPIFRHMKHKQIFLTFFMYSYLLVTTINVTTCCGFLVYALHDSASIRWRKKRQCDIYSEGHQDAKDFLSYRSWSLYRLSCWWQKRSSWGFKTMAGVMVATMVATITG